MANYRSLPVVTLGAEYLTIALLMRRNALAYKAPPMNEGYDLICVHPDSKVAGQKAIRVQVKSRYQIDSDRAVLLKEGKLSGCQFVSIVFLNIGHFFSKRRRAPDQPRSFELWILPVELVRKHLYRPKSGMAKLYVDKIPEITKYSGEDGIELVAKALSVESPAAG